MRDPGNEVRIPHMVKLSKLVSVCRIWLAEENISFSLMRHKFLESVIGAAQSSGSSARVLILSDCSL